MITTNAVLLSLVILTNYTPCAQVTATNTIPNRWYDLQNTTNLADWSGAVHTYCFSDTNYFTIFYPYDYRTYDQQFYRVLEATNEP